MRPNTHAYLQRGEIREDPINPSKYSGSLCSKRKDATVADESFVWLTWLSNVSERTVCYTLVVDVSDQSWSCRTLLLVLFYYVHSFHHSFSF